MERTESALPGVPDPGETIRVLQVDDDESFLEVAAGLLEDQSERLTVATESDAGAAMDRIAAESVDCVVSDYRMSGTDGLEFLASVREHDPDLPFVLFTGKGSEDIAAEALRAGVTDYLQKGGGPNQYAVLANRITNAVDQYRMEHAVVETEQRYRTLIDHSRDVISVLDADGVFQYVSPGVGHTAGYDPGELVGESAFDYIHPDDRRTVRDQFEIGQDMESPGRVEYRFLGADDQYHWYESIASNEYESAVGGYVISSREITDRKERERELQQYERMMQTIPDGAFLLDENGTMTRVNEAWGEMVGYPPGELEGEPFTTLVEDGVIDREIVDHYLEIVKDMLSGEEDKQTFTVELVPPDDDREHVYQAHVALLPFDEGFRGTAGVVRDVTENVRRRRELERQNERLEKFASVVSHDLRNPLDIAISRAELIRDEGELERADALVDTLESMSALIDDVLALARQGRVVDDPDPVELGDVVEDAADQVGIDWIETELEVVDDLPTVVGDPQRLRALFENLFVNAVEHGSRDETGPSDGTGDGVEIRVGTIDDGDVESSVRGGFFVADDGPGIPPEERDRVFEVGYTNAEDGTGFGLNIVREIVEAHDWSIRVTEGDGGGARFEVTNVQLLDRTDPPRQYE